MPAIHSWSIKQEEICPVCGKPGPAEVFPPMEGCVHGKDLACALVNCQYQSECIHKGKDWCVNGPIVS